MSMHLWGPIDWKNDARQSPLTGFLYGRILNTPRKI